MRSRVGAAAAVLYGIGARLDEAPELLFTLRKVDAQDLVARASADLPLARKAPAAGRVLEDAALAEVFGIEMAEAAAAPVAAPARRAPPPKAKRTPAERPAAKRRQAKTAARGLRKPAGKRVPSRRKR